MRKQNSVGVLLSALFIIIFAFFNDGMLKGEYSIFIWGGPLIGTILFGGIFYVCLYLIHIFLSLVTNLGMADKYAFRWLNISSIISSIVTPFLFTKYSWFALLSIPIVHLFTRIIVPFLIKRKEILSDDWTFTDRGIVFQTGTELKRLRDGLVESGTLAEDWKNPDTGMILSANSEVVFSKKHHLMKYTLKENWIEPRSKVVLKANEIIECYENQQFKKIILAEDFIEKSGRVLKANVPVLFNPNGTYRD